MKLELTPEIEDLLQEAWLQNGPSMADADRPVERLAQLLFEQSATVWYQGPGKSWVYLTEVTPGSNANMHALNLDGWPAVDVVLVRKLLAEAMQENNIHRLTIAIPAPVAHIAIAAQKLGFKKEGMLREACIFNQAPTDVTVFGLLRPDVFGPPPKRRRRRRSRRKSWHTITGKPITKE